MKRWEEHDHKLKFVVDYIRTNNIELPKNQAKLAKILYDYSAHLSAAFFLKENNMKNMKLVRSNTRCDLEIDRDAGNAVLVLMGGKTKKNIRENWEALRSLCDEALESIKGLTIPEN